MDWVIGFIIGSCAAVAITLIAAITFGTIKSNEGYYALAGDCVRSGGTWVPHGDGWCLVGVGRKP